MGKQSKRLKAISEQVDADREYSLEEAIALLKKCPEVKFNQSVDISMKLGVDPKKADQQVRGTVLLPHGTGKTIRVLVLTKGDQVEKALSAGADFAGSDEYIDKIKGGWTDFDAVVTTPDMMREVGKLGKVLGPRGLMPTPKAGTVTKNIEEAVKALKKGKIEFKVDKSAVMNNAVGKLSFDDKQLQENAMSLISAIVKAKPVSSKGVYVEGAYLSSTMGPGLKLTSGTFQG